MCDNAVCTCSLCTILNSTVAKATAATVPTAYSAVLMPASRERLTSRSRRAIRFRRVMPRVNCPRARQNQVPGNLWTTPSPVENRLCTMSDGPPWTRRPDWARLHR